MYEQPSLHLELARLKHKDYEIEARQARLAAQAGRPPSESLAFLKSAVASLRGALSRRDPVVVHQARLQSAG